MGDARRTLSSRSDWQSINISRVVFKLQSPRSAGLLPSHLKEVPRASHFAPGKSQGPHGKNAQHLSKLTQTSVSPSLTCTDTIGLLCSALNSNNLCSRKHPFILCVPGDLPRARHCSETLGLRQETKRVKPLPSGSSHPSREGHTRHTNKWPQREDGKGEWVAPGAAT